MKNLLKLIGVITMVAVIGFSMTACDSGGSDPLPVDTRIDPTVTWPADGSLTAMVEQTLSQVTIPAHTGTTPGAFSWTTPTASVGAEGSRSHNMTFTPNDTATYKTVNKNVTITVGPLVQTITVTVNGGTGSGSYPLDTIINITPVVPNGMVFKEWTVLQGNGSSSNGFPSDFLGGWANSSSRDENTQYKVSQDWGNGIIITAHFVPLLTVSDFIGTWTADYGAENGRKFVIAADSIKYFHPNGWRDFTSTTEPEFVINFEGSSSSQQTYPSGISVETGLSSPYNNLRLYLNIEKTEFSVSGWQYPIQQGVNFTKVE